MNQKKLYWTIVLLIFSGLIFLAIFYPETEKPLKISMLDIGQGDAIYIETPSGANMLIDAGRDRTVMHELSNKVHYGQIDILEVSNPDLDHIGGFPFVLEKYKVNKIISPGTNRTGIESFNKIQELAEAKKINIEKPKSGAVYVLDKENDITYTILWPEGNTRDWDSNPGSMIGILEYDGKKILFTGDAPKEVEDQIVSKYTEVLKNIDILKVGHHGSKTSTGENLINIAKPKYALISAGKNNRYGHPHEEVMKNLQKFDSKILITSIQGEINCTVFKQKEVSCE